MFRFVSLIIVALSQIVSGCVSTVKTLDGESLRVGSPEFRDHAEAVFKRNNSTLTELFEAFELASDEDAARLDLAEQRLIEACETLNRAAAAQRDGQKLGTSTLLTISSTIRPCDEATFETDQLIREIKIAN